MKIRFEHNGTIFEYERKPLPESRFKALCAVAEAGIYAGIVVAAMKMCGVFGLLLAAALGMVLVIPKM